jgi:hypothetical protein
VTGVGGPHQPDNGALHIPVTRRPRDGEKERAETRPALPELEQRQLKPPTLCPTLTLPINCSHHRDSDARNYLRLGKPLNNVLPTIKQVAVGDEGTREIGHWILHKQGGKTRVWDLGEAPPHEATMRPANKTG